MMPESVDFNNVSYDDSSVPAETEIYYDRKQIAKNAIFFTILFLVGLFLVLSNYNLILGCILMLIGIGVLYFDYKKYQNNSLACVVSNRGITRSTNEFYSWNEIKNEQLKDKSSSKRSGSYLYYEYPPDKKEWIDVVFLKLSREQLTTLLTVYRSRHERQIKVYEHHFNKTDK